MIVVLLAATMLLLLSLVRRAIEPVCPNCTLKSWTPHSTQLQCARCGWTNGRVAAASAPAVPEQPQYEIAFNG
jgi:hypothetical protein